MKRDFQNLDIQCWNHRGRLERRQPCICLQAAADACGVLLAAIDELGAEGPPAQRSLSLKACQRARRCGKIRLVLSPKSDELQEMSLAINDQTAVLEFTADGLTIFRDAVMACRDGGEDFSVGPSEKLESLKDSASGEIWFWTPLTDP